MADVGQERQEKRDIDGRCGTRETGEKRHRWQMWDERQEIRNIDGRCGTSETGDKRHRWQVWDKRDRR